VKWTGVAYVQSMLLSISESRGDSIGCDCAVVHRRRHLRHVLFEGCDAPRRPSRNV